MDKNNTDRCRCNWLSPLKLTLLAINAVCFGGCLVLLALGRGGGPVLLLTFGTGLAMLAGLTGALMATRRTKNPVVEGVKTNKT